MNEQPEKADRGGTATQTVPIRLGLLGAFQLVLGDNRKIEVSSKKNRALLAILALSPGLEATRDRLSGLLWGDRGEEQARSSLRQSLAVLRKELGDTDASLLQTHDDLVALRPEKVSIDAVEIGKLSAASDLQSLRRGAALWRGELLADTSIKDHGFEDWVSAERRRLAGVAITLFEKLCAADKDQASVDAASRLVELDPLREASQRALMRALAATGETALALQQYNICRALLKAEFGIEPASETVALSVEIARAKMTPAKVPAVAGVDGGHGRPKQSESKPAIAILPFANQSGDPAQEYIGNGMAEDIGIELARYHSLSVVASNASSHFRGPGLDLAAIRQVLGVRYVLDGSIRKGGDTFRMTVQLIEAETGKQLWAERYDKAADEIFAVQDDVVRTIVSTLEGRLAVTAAAHLRTIPTTSWAAYDYFLQGRELSNRYRAHEADRFLARAIELDPDFIHAYAWRASTLIVKYWDDLNPEVLQQAVDCAKKALSLDESDAWCHQAMGFVSLHSGKLELAGMHFERAISLNTNDVNILADYANWLCYVGRFDEAMECLDRAMQRDPFPPAWMWEVRGSVLLLTHRYEEAIVAFQKAPIENFFTHACLAATYAWAGQMENARSELALARRGREDKLFAIMAHFPNPRRDHLLEGLRKAGLME